MNDNPDARFDVVIYEIASGKIDMIAGENLRRDTGFYNAEKRINTVLPRLNDAYSARIVDTGKYRVGDFITSKDR